MSEVAILERSVYGVAEAAELLSLRPERVRAWLDGYTRKQTSYPPVIRESRTGSDVVTWGEYVELGYLREYRNHNVSLQRLRVVIDKLRDELQTPYPLATARPFVHDRDLVWQVQEDANLPRTLAIVVRTEQVIGLGDVASRFLRKVEFEEPEQGNIVRMRPAGRTSPVVMDPMMRFGRPTVGGASTERLWELYDAGEPPEWIARAYSLTIEEVNAALAYEEQRLAA